MGDTGGLHRDSAITLAQGKAILKPPLPLPVLQVPLGQPQHNTCGVGEWGQKPNRPPTPRKPLVGYLPVMLTAGEGSLVLPSPGSHRPQLCSWGESNCPQDYSPLGLSPPHPHAFPKQTTRQGQQQLAEGVTAGSSSPESGGSKKSGKGPSSSYQQWRPLGGVIWVRGIWLPGQGCCLWTRPEIWGSDAPLKDTQSCHHLARHRQESRSGGESIPLLL